MTMDYKPTPEQIAARAAKAKATREANAKLGARVAEWEEQTKHLAELDKAKVEKLEAKTVERGATPAEAESARAKAEELRRKAKPEHPNFSGAPPLPTVEEM